MMCFVVLLLQALPDGSVVIYQLYFFMSQTEGRGGKLTLRQYLDSLKHLGNFDKVVEASAIFLAQFDRGEIDDVRDEYIETYGEMMIKDSLSDRLDDIEDEISDAEERIKELKGIIAAATNDDRRNKAKAERAELIRKRATLKNTYEVLAELEETGKISQDDAFNDWKVISGLRGLREISFDTSSDGIKYPILSFRVYYPYDGMVYDFGDWDIVFNPDLDYGSVHITNRRRSAVKQGWGHIYPNYEYEDGAFCLGVYSSDVEGLRASYRFSEAFSMIVDCFHSVNDESEMCNIPECFFEAEADARAINLLDDYLRREGLI